MGAPAGIDWSWAVATGGTLTSAQRRQLLTPLLRTVAAYGATRARLLAGGRGHGGVDLDTLVARRARWSRALADPGGGPPRAGPPRPVCGVATPVITFDVIHATL